MARTDKDSSELDANVRLNGKILCASGPLVTCSSQTGGNEKLSQTFSDEFCRRQKYIQKSRETTVTDRFVSTVHSYSPLLLLPLPLAVVMSTKLISKRYANHQKIYFQHTNDTHYTCFYNQINCFNSIIFAYHLQYIRLHRFI